MSALAVTEMERARRPQLRAYGAFVRVGVRGELATRAAVIGRMALICVILLVFSRLWAIVLQGGALRDHTRADLVWYIVITELVVLSFPYLHLQVEEDLRSGELIARLPQPVDYVGARVAEAAGGVAVRIVILLPAGAVAATVFGGGLPAQPGGLLLALPLLLLGCSLAVISSAAIGLGVLWLHDASPLFWLWQKLTFVLGGLLIPLEIYPPWLRSCASWTPFAAMLNGPGRMAFGFDLRDAATVALQLLAWNIAGVLGLAWLWSRALRALDAYGG